MRSYDEMPTIIQEMKRAVIDCYMADSDYPVHFTYDDTYALWGYVAANSYSRPGSDGEGGGSFTGWIDHGHPSRAGTFDEIRSNLDSWIDQWLGLPDGSACADPISATGNTASALGASGSSPSVQDNGEISTANGTVNDVVIAHLEGDFVAPFYDKYYTQFASVYYGIGAGCALLEMNYKVEEAIWKPLRDDVVNLCVNATNAWKEQAELTADAYGAVALTVVGAVAGAIATIATAGAAAPGVAVLVGLSTTAAAAGAGLTASATISGSSHGEIWDSWTDGLDALNEAVRTQEQAIDTMLTEANNHIYGDLPSFDLDQFKLSSYPGNNGTIQVENQHSTMIQTNMGRIETALSGASTTLGYAPASPVPRSEYVGIGADGTHGSASTLYSTMVTCLSRTTNEYALGRDLFAATMADFFNTDAGAAAESDRLAKSEAITGTW